MKPLLFTLRSEPEQRLDLSPLVPDRLIGRSIKEIERLEIGTTRICVKAGDMFKIRPGDANSIRFEGGSERFDLVGAKMLPGAEIYVDGDVGAQAGRLAKGGSLTIAGSAGPYAASGLVDGRIEIDGDAGDLLGAPLAGELAGMAGGRVIVRGSVGARAGDRLQRGVIVIEGSAGDDLGARIIAGTIVLLGRADGRPGYLMKRGTIVMSEPPELGPTFVDCGPLDFSFTRLYARSLAQDSRKAARLLDKRLRRYAGDTGVFGKGEILIPA